MISARAIAFLGVCGALLCIGAAGAAGAVHAPQPQRVRSASLTQDGQQVIWSVQLERPFSPKAMKQARRTLCLVLERAKRATSTGMLCMTAPRVGGTPRLVYIPTSGHNAGQAISATVTRPSTSSLRASFLPGSVGLSYASLRWQVSTSVTAAGCQPQPRRTGPCAALFPGRPVSLALHVPRPVGCVPSGPAQVFSGPSRGRVVALTFDDGPWPDTPQFLDVLERKHVPATFFQIGEQVSTYGRAVDRRMLADGDVIGDHTWSHPDVSGDGPFARSQIGSTAAAIRSLTGFTPCLFRPPGGATSGALVAEARSMGFTTIQWDIDPRDWSRPGTGAIYSTVVGGAHPGAIILQHDGGGDRSETLAALPNEIDTLRRAGYGFVTIPELFGQRLIYK